MRSYATPEEDALIRAAAAQIGEEEAAAAGSRVRLAAVSSSTDPPAPAEFLTGQLGLSAAGLRVSGADVFGRGPEARVTLHLGGRELPNGRATLVFDRFADVASPRLLSAHLVTLTGVYRTFKAPEAGAIAAAVFQLAKHHDQADDETQVIEWCSEFLRVAPRMDTDLNDQLERYGAFETLARLNPARDAGEDRSALALACASLVLVDRNSGQRLVRCGWLRDFVKREVGGLYSPARLASLVEAVGWNRPGSQGRVKATCPTDGRRLLWTFYVVDADWEERQVNAGESSNARTRAGAREEDLPAFTRSPAPETA